MTFLAISYLIPNCSMILFSLPATTMVSLYQRTLGSGSPYTIHDITASSDTPPCTQALSTSISGSSGNFLRISMPRQLSTYISHWGQQMPWLEGQHCCLLYICRSHGQTYWSVRNEDWDSLSSYHHWATIDAEKSIFYHWIIFCQCLYHKYFIGSFFNSVQCTCTLAKHLPSIKKSA